jgi:hypothetical protein
MRKKLVTVAAAVMLFVVVVAPSSAAPPPSVTERCDTPVPMTFVQCVTYGEHWVYLGTAGNDRIVGTEWPEIIRSGKGIDYVDGGRGPDDVCYVQPRDTVKRCEEER